MISITLLVLWRNGTYSFECFTSLLDKDEFLTKNDKEILSVRVEEFIDGNGESR